MYIMIQSILLWYKNNSKNKKFKCLPFLFLSATFCQLFIVKLFCKQKKNKIFLIITLKCVIVITTDLVSSMGLIKIKLNKYCQQM